MCSCSVIFGFGLAMVMMMMGLDFLYFLVTWVVKNSCTLVLPLINLHCAGARGSPIIFYVGTKIFVLLRNPCKISEPYDNPTGRMIPERERKKITPLIMATTLALLAHAVLSDQ